MAPASAAGELVLDDGDAEQADADVDEDAALPPPHPMTMEEIPIERAGRDCGVGCRQLTFAAPVVYEQYSVDTRYLIYMGDAETVRERGVFLVDLSTRREYQIEKFETTIFTLPGVFDETLAYSSTSYGESTLLTLWRYRIGDSLRYPVITRRMTERARTMHHFSLSASAVAWYDSSIAPAGLFAMNLEGGELISLTSVRCVCYGDPQLVGRQVVYEGWQTGFRDIWLVDIDTLEERNLTSFGAPQTSPAFDGRWVLWVDSRNDPGSDPALTPVNSDLYAMTLPDGEEVEVTTHPAIQHRPDVDVGLAVWVDFRHAADPNDWNVREPDTDLYLRDLDAGSGEVRITDLDGRVWRPYIVGHRVFFIWDDLLDQRAVFMIDLVEAGIIDPDR